MSDEIEWLPVQDLNVNEVANSNMLQFITDAVQGQGSMRFIEDGEQPHTSGFRQEQPLAQAMGGNAVIPERE